MLIAMRSLPLVPASLALLLAGGCKKEEPVLRPADAPDVMVLGVSGHCLPIMGLCDGNFNPEYLSNAGTIEAISHPLFEEAGLGVQYGAFVDGWYSWVDTEDELLAAGFVDLVATLEVAHADWMDGFDNPTRIVLLGHGHGVVWTHLAARALPDVPIEAIVDLDGVSAGWGSDEGFFGVDDEWPSSIPEFVAESDRTWPIDDWRADPDHVSDNVVLNLEVWSTPNPFQEGSDVFDGEPNARDDGSTHGIRTCTSATDHFGVYEPGSDCMEWTVDQLIGALPERSGNGR